MNKAVFGRIGREFVVPKPAQTITRADPQVAILAFDNIVNFVVG